LQHTTRLDSDPRGPRSASSVFLVGLVMLAFLASANALYAQTGRQLFVSTSGNDANSGTQLQPFRTIQHAADVVAAGDVVTVADGVYTGSCGGAIVCLSRGGSAGNPVTFRAEHRGGAKLDGRNNTNTDGIVFQSTANYVVIDGFEIYGVGNASGSSSAIEVYAGGHDSVITHNDIHDIGRLCTSTSNGEVGVFIEQPNVRVIGNRIHDIGRFAPGENGCSTNTYYQTHDHGVYADGENGGSGIPGATNAFIANNVFFNNARGWSIQVYPGTVNGLSILNNTFAFANPYQDGHIILGANTANARIMNNIFYKPHGAAIDYYTGTQSNLQITENVVYGATLLTSTPSGTLVTANQVVDPLFTSVAAPYDFRLKSGSPALNAGVTLVEVPTDFTGAPRNDGLYDVGAYEGTGAAQQQTAAAPTITPNGGTVSGPISVSLMTTTAGATIRYTLDGSTPTSSSPAYTGAFTISQGLTVRAMAQAAGMLDSPVSQAIFSTAMQSVAAPAISPNGGVVSSPMSVTLATTTAGATIRYTLDGSTPSSSSPAYTGPFTVATALTVRAKAMMAGMLDSPVSQATFQNPVTSDTVLPVVSFTSPSDGSSVRRWVTFTASASDNVAVKSVKFSVDGQTIATVTSGPYTASYNFRRSSSGRHVVTAVATDTSGNTRSVSISVYR
jgi:hypothetical protein